MLSKKKKQPSVQFHPKHIPKRSQYKSRYKNPAPPPRVHPSTVSSGMAARTGVNFRRFARGRHSVRTDGSVSGGAGRLAGVRLPPGAAAAVAAATAAADARAGGAGGDGTVLGSPEGVRTMRKEEREAPLPTERTTLPPRRDMAAGRGRRRGRGGLWVRTGE